MKTARARSGLFGRQEFMGVFFHGDARRAPNTRDRGDRRDGRRLDLDTAPDQPGACGNPLRGVFRVRRRLAHRFHMPAIAPVFNETRDPRRKRGLRRRRRLSARPYQTRPGYLNRRRRLAGRARCVDRARRRGVRCGSGLRRRYRIRRTRSEVCRHVSGSRLTLKVAFTQEAREDLPDVADYITRGSPQRAHVTTSAFMMLSADSWGSGRRVRFA